MNRSAGRVCIFDDAGDYAAFERVLAEAVARFAMRLCAYVLMPNHFHLVLWPRGDDELSKFMQWLTMTHTQRWHAHRHSAGRGHLYQGRFKCFAIELDEHYLAVCRYAERNALRATLVARVNATETAEELEALRRACRRGTPYDGEGWSRRTAAALGKRKGE